MKRLFLSLFLLAFLLSGCTTEKPAATTAEPPSYYFLIKIFDFNQEGIA